MIQRIEAALRDAGISLDVSLGGEVRSRIAHLARRHDADSVRLDRSRRRPRRDCGEDSIPDRTGRTSEGRTAQRLESGWSPLRPARTTGQATQRRRKARDRPENARQHRLAPSLKLGLQVENMVQQDRGFHLEGHADSVRPSRDFRRCACSAVVFPLRTRRPFIRIRQAEYPRGSRRKLLHGLTRCQADLNPIRATSHSARLRGLRSPTSRLSMR